MTEAIGAPPSSAHPISCPRCETSATDWCCRELQDIKDRIARGETMRQLLTAHPGTTEDAMRGICRRYGLGRPRPGIRTRRTRCAMCRTPFAPTTSGQKACDKCDPPLARQASAVDAGDASRRAA